MNLQRLCSVIQAFNTDKHPLGTLMQRLEIVYKASYGGIGANKYLLPHAIAETHSLIQRIHGIVRYVEFLVTLRTEYSVIPSKCACV